MKLDLCIYEVLIIGYTHTTMQTAFVGVAITINIKVIFLNIS